MNEHVGNDRLGVVTAPRTVRIERILPGLLGQLEVPGGPDQRRDRLAGLVAEDAVQDRVDTGHGPSTSGRISTEGEGMRWATAIASSRSGTSTR